MSSDNHVSFDPRALRIQMNLNQQEFWSAIGVTQSGGSRYENDRHIPRPVMELLRLRYQLGIKLDGIHAGNARIIRALASGSVSSSALRDHFIRIQDVLSASEKVAHEAKQLSHAAQALLQSPAAD